MKQLEPKFQVQRSVESHWIDFVHINRELRITLNTRLIFHQIIYRLVPETVAELSLSLPLLVCTW